MHREAARPLRASVRVRISVAAALVFAIAVGLTSLVMVRTVNTSLRDEVRNEGERTLAEYERQVRAGVRLGNLPRPSVSSVTYLQVLDANGNVIGGSPGFADDDPPLFRRPPIGVQGAPERRVEGDVMYTYTRVTTSTGRPVVLVATSTLDDVARSVDAVSHTLWLVMPVLVLMVGGVAWVVTGRALRPVEAIRAEVERITASSLDRRVPEPGSRDEVDRLAHTMNQMLDRLEGASTRQRRFVSDASHELRSPVATIRATGEVALAHPEQADWERVVHRMLDEDERLGRIVDDLLLLARDDEGMPPPAATEVDLDDAVLEEAIRVRNVEVRTEQVSAGRVRGSRDQLARVVRNLLDNAARHASTTVVVALRVEGDDVVLNVDDDGPGIAPEDTERVFERFTRLDEGRARDAGGLGLGLAMVRSIVERHGGTVCVQTAPPPLGGARLEVRLPAV
ncbi:MAG: HAMP domain-containing protein [Actinobacteria bacterium]|nr:HAMP domain-containing protein [Actinomycetota bacterium]